jgi:hypothetical protein
MYHVKRKREGFKATKKKVKSKEGVNFAIKTVWFSMVFGKMTKRMDKE